MAKRPAVNMSQVDSLMEPQDATREPDREPRGQLNVNIPADALNKARDAVYWTPGLTLADLVSEAVTRELARLEKQRGEPYPNRKGNIKTGRPIR